MDLETTKAYALAGNHSAGIGHGSWSLPLGPADKKAEPGILNSHAKEVREELPYSSRDIEAVEEWVKRHVESTWHSLGTCSMAPREGNSIVKHGVLDERLNVHGVKGLKVADLSICPDNVGCRCSSLLPCAMTKLTSAEATPTQLLFSLVRSVLFSLVRTLATPGLLWT